MVSRAAAGDPARHPLTWADRGSVRHGPVRAGPAGPDGDPRKGLTACRQSRPTALSTTSPIADGGDKPLNSKETATKQRLTALGLALAVIGLGFLVGGGVAFAKTQDGYNSLQAFSEAQNVTLTYNEDGQLTDRGTTEGADAIMTLLKEDWAYPVVESDLDPNDPLVNTSTEYMYQMATVAFHTLHGTQTVVLEEAVEYNGETFEPGTYEFEVDGRYWTDFDREHPIEGPAREQAWSGTAHGLVGELGVGTVTHSALQMGLGIAALLAALGATLVLAGTGLVWVGRGKVEFGITAREGEAAAPRETVTV